MNLSLDEVQKDLLASLATLLERHAGVPRARAMIEADAMDVELFDRLAAAGFVDRVAEGWSLLDGVLIIEAAAAAAATVPLASHVLLGQELWGSAAPRSIALTDRLGAPARFGAQADAIVVVSTSGVEVVREPRVVGGAKGVAYPAASFEGDREPVDADPVRARALWRVGLAAEMAGTMAAAVDIAVAHVRTREQFGRTLDDFQAVQHRLAESTVAVQGTRWLARRAAGLDADPELAAAAATYACRSAATVLTHTHRVCGAIGVTDEFDLSIYTMRLRALAAELGGRSAHARDLATLRYLDPARRDPADVNERTVAKTS